MDPEYRHIFGRRILSSTHHLKHILNEFWYIVVWFSSNHTGVWLIMADIEELRRSPISIRGQVINSRVADRKQGIALEDYTANTMGEVALCRGCSGIKEESKNKPLRCIKLPDENVQNKLMYLEK